MVYEYRLARLSYSVLLLSVMWPGAAITLGVKLGCSEHPKWLSFASAYQLVAQLWLPITGPQSPLARSLMGSGLLTAQQLHFKRQKAEAASPIKTWTQKSGNITSCSEVAFILLIIASYKLRFKEKNSFFLPE